MADSNTPHGQDDSGRQNRNHGQSQPAGQGQPTQGGQAGQGHQPQSGQARQGQGTPAGGGSGRAQQQASVPLLDGEEILIDARPAWSAYMVQFIVAGLFLIGGLVAGDESVIVGVVVAGLIIGYVWWQRQKLRYVVTDRRLMKITGGGSRSTNEAWMADVRNLQTGASLLERLLGHGHITVSTEIMPSAGSIPILGMFFTLISGSGMSFDGIANYEEVASVVRERQNEVKQG